MKARGSEKATERERERIPLLPRLPQFTQAFREGGEDGVVEGLAPRERRLPPQESLGGWDGGSVFIYDSLLMF